MLVLRKRGVPRVRSSSMCRRICASVTEHTEQLPPDGGLEGVLSVDELFSSRTYSILHQNAWRWPLAECQQAETAAPPQVTPARSQMGNGRCLLAENLETCVVSDTCRSCGVLMTA